MQIAVLTTVLPAGRRTGGEVVTQAVIESLRAAGHRVDVVGYQRRGGAGPAVGEHAAGSRGIETARATKGELLGWAATALARRQPFSVAKYVSAAYRRTVVAVASETPPDLVIVVPVHAAWARSALDTVPTVVLAHNVEHEVYASAAGGVPHTPEQLLRRREARAMLRFEQEVLAEVTEVWALTREDEEGFRSLGARAVRLVEPPGTIDPPPQVARDRQLAALGTWSWAPNAEGLRWACDEVLPRLPPGTILDVAGTGGEWAEEVPGVRHHGRVPDAGAFLARARVVLIPSTGGPGVQMKTLDALGAGCWVVGARGAFRGLDVGPDVATVVDDADGCAAEIARLLGDPRTERPCEAALQWSADRVARFDATVAGAAAALSG